MKETLVNYFSFLRYPRLLKLSKDKNTLQKDFFWLFLLNLLFTGIILSIYMVLLNFKLIREYEDFDPFKMYGPFWGMMMIVIAAPLLEESLFRFQLRRYTLSIWFVVISLALVFFSFIDDEPVRFFVGIVFFIIAVLATLMKEKMSIRKGYLIWKKYYVFLFYYTALIFGYIHITNMKGLTVSDPSFVLYIGSQIFGGMTMGYIRIKYGLIYSILFHACFNLVVGGGSLLFSHL